jgi:hypothetical protein
MKVFTRKFKLSRICEVCKEPIPYNSLKRVYCSKECSKIGRSQKAKEYAKEMKEINMKLHRCTKCGADNPNYNKYRWCKACREKNKLKKIKMRQMDDRNTY